MKKWLLIVESSCNDPAREKEFNHWYDKIHLPDIFETRGFVRATRYELHQVTKSAGDKGKYLCLYEIEADDLDAVMAKHTENMKQKREQGRFSNLIETKSRAMYKQITSFPE